MVLFQPSVAKTGSASDSTVPMSGARPTAAARVGQILFRTLVPTEPVAKRVCCPHPTRRQTDANHPVPPADHVTRRAGGLLSGHTHFLHWGVVQISLTNFIIIVVMVVIFVLALVVPFPHGKSDVGEENRDER
jgi:hypothetical protein